MAKMTLEVVTPQRVVLKTDADYVTIPGEVGELGVLPGHIPLLTNLKTGVLSYNLGSDVKKLAIHYGYAEINQDKITVLAKLAERAEEIDIERSIASLKRAETELERIMRQREQMDSLKDAQMIAKLQNKIFRSLTRQKAAGK